ncbi:MAG: hypothetical protein ACLUGV_08675 [Alistipes shahii]
MASSYRGCGDKNNPAEINKQTFLACNISAQRMDNSKAFQTLWAAAERRFTDQYVCADTLYCVSGAYFADENTPGLRLQLDFGRCEVFARGVFERVHRADPLLQAAAAYP